MTTRGKSPNPARPITPPDTTLKTNPIPKTRLFKPTAYGPGAGQNINALIRPLSEIAAASNPSTYLSPIDKQYAAGLGDGIQRLLDKVVRDSQIMIDDDEGRDLPVGYGDPTWGFYGFVVDYDDHTLSKIPSAMENLVHVTRRSIRAQTTASYADEVIQRFKMDVVMHEAALASASTDRVREEFKAYLRYQRLLGTDHIIRGAVRNYACFVLDKSTVSMLSDLSLDLNLNLSHEITTLEEAMEEWRLLGGKTITLVDAWWERPAINAHGFAYRGVDECPITDLAYFYMEVSTGSNSHSMRDLWPMKNGPLGGSGGEAC